jgi:hypothetical protein
MSDAYFIQSLLDGSVIDVQGAKAAAGTPIHLYPQKSVSSPPTTEQLQNAANQLWTSVNSSTANYFWIASQLNSDLVIDVVNDDAVPGASLQIATQKTGSIEKNQLWTLIGVQPPHPPGTLADTYFMFESQANSNLVITVDTPVSGGVAGLSLYTKLPTGTQAQFDAAKTQLWSQVLDYYPPPK